MKTQQLGLLRSKPTLLEILRPTRFPGNATRAKVTRTVVQPDIDKFGKPEARESTLLKPRHQASASRRRDRWIVQAQAGSAGAASR